MDVCVRLECSKSMKMFMFDGRRMLGDFMSCGAIMSQVFEADSNRLSTYRRPMNDQRNCIAGEPRNSKISVRKKIAKLYRFGRSKVPYGTPPSQKHVHMCMFLRIAQKIKQFRTSAGHRLDSNLATTAPEATKRPERPLPAHLPTHAHLAETFLLASSCLLYTSPSPRDA